MPLRLAVLLSLLIAPSARAELLWPLQQPAGERALSSSFCEDRGSHLHGGVDMSTGGVVGAPVLAAADGSIVRVKVKYRGLGRAVYVQHAGGLMSVYGHLAGFAEPVRSWVDAAIAKKGSYPGDLFPDTPIPVRAGQVIAWSGKTGGGPPHLHFETRRSGGNRPVDPWAEGLPCIDRTPPIIDALSIHPRDALTLEDKGGPQWTERVVDLPTPQAIELDGSELLRLRVRDPFGAGTGFVRRLTVSIEDWELYRWDAGSYAYGITKFAGHAFSRGAPRGAAASAPGSWVWLHEWPGAGLPFVTGRSVMDSWTLGAPGDRIELTIRAWDGCGNEASSRVPVDVIERSERTGSSAAEALALIVTFERSPSGEGVDAVGRPHGLGGGRYPAPPHGRLEPGARLELRGTGVRLDIPSGACEAPAEVVLASLDGSPPSFVPYPEPMARPHEGLVVHGPPALTGPEALPLARKATVAFTRPHGPEARRLGVYRWDPAGGSWQFWGDNVSTADEVGTTTDRLGTFALFEDAWPPKGLSVGRRLVRGQPWRADAEELVMRYEEHGEGVAWNGVRFRPAGSDEEWIAMHDPDLAEGAFLLPASLAEVTVKGTLVLEDHAGNVSEIPVLAHP